MKNLLILSLKKVHLRSLHYKVARSMYANTLSSNTNKVKYRIFFNEDIASKTLYEQQYSNDDVRVNKFILSVVNPAIR